MMYRTVFTLRNLLGLLCVALVFCVFILNHANLWSQGYKYHKLREIWESSLDYTMSFFFKICCNISPSSVQTKKGQRGREFHFVGFFDVDTSTR